MKHYDIIVIGSGGGSKITSPAARLGYKVAVIEKEDLGGTCLNRGCIPSKMLIHPANLIRQIEDSKKFELGLDAKFSVDFASLTTRVTNTVTNDSRKIAPAYKKNPNIDLYPFEAKFESNKTININGEVLTADRIFIAVGSRPQIPNISGLSDVPYMTSREALRNTALPKKLLVIGGGYIGCELGHAYSAFGSDVHFIVRSKFLKHEDSDIISEFTKEFSRYHGVHLGDVPVGVSFDGKEYSLVCKTETGETVTHRGDALLIATGVIPNSDLLDLHKTDIKCDLKGHISVNEYLETSVPGVYAMGDVIGRHLFRHTVNFEGEYLMDTLFVEPRREPLDYGPVPHAVFTHPEIAGVGKTEPELKKEGIDYVVGTSHYKNTAMGMARLSESGFVKVLVDRKTKKLLGAHIIGDEASNMIHMFIALMSMNASLDDMLRMIYVHPALPEVARNAGRKALAELLKST